jgi:flagellar hook-basal body complex protein FliE
MERISDIQAFQPTVQPLGVMPSGPTPMEGPLSFSQVFKTSLEEVNGLDTQSKRMVESLATGETNDVSGVMLAVKKANMAFLSILQVRNQAIEAYQEIMRMRV